ncbi:hypothetical protein F5879DRAFT_995900 [Lentinula edodes]|nr:hypothetical protein F5879DRAFT_995900 [Lentinula edodes]
MSFPSSSAITGAPNPVLPPVSSPSHPNSAELTVDAAINELAHTLEEPPLEARRRQIVPSSPTLLDVVTAMTRNPAFWVGLPAFVIFRWRDIAAKIEASTNSTVTLIELNLLDEQDQQKLDRLELGEFLRKQPQLPRPSTTNSLPPPIPSVVATPRALAKKRKRSIWQEEGGSSSLRKRPVREVSQPEVAPEVHECKCKCPVGESWDAEVPDYRHEGGFQG